MTLEVHHENTWEVFDPSDARVIAQFWREDEAFDYVRWRETRVQRQESRTVISAHSAALRDEIDRFAECIGKTADEFRAGLSKLLEGIK